MKYLRSRRGWTTFLFFLLLFSSTTCFRDSIIGNLVVKIIPLPDTKSSKKAQKDQKRIADTLYSEHTFYTNGLLYTFNQNARVPRQAYGEAHGFRYLVMEKFDVTLPEYVEREGRSINCSTVANIGLQILTGLQHIHNTVSLLPQRLRSRSISYSLFTVN